MKKLTITNVNTWKTKTRHSGLIDWSFEGMDEKEDSVNFMEVSDGYHTMGELYEHRIILWITVCRLNHNDPQYQHTRVWRSKLHADGSSFEGWFILGMTCGSGKQLSYHLPISKWEETEFAQTLEKAPEWDGHTSADVLERLKKL